MTRSLLFSFLVSATAVGCLRTRPPELAPTLASSCRSASVRWYTPADDRDRTRLDSWCAGVGAPVIQPIASSHEDDSVSLEDVTFVSWNVHVGNGDILAFVDDLRAGRLTNGRPVRHFVLLLQEVVRAGGVPPYLEGASGARRIDADDASLTDIGEISRRLGLSLIYVPSMRNGDSPQEVAADRGSAILSTLPLSDPTAVELPGERQRRVAIVAKLALRSVGESAQPVSVAVMHLDALGASKRLWLFGTSGMREVQAKAIESVWPEGSLIVGADLNTWHGTDEPAVRYLAQLFGSTPVTSTRDRLGLRVLDYIFFRAEDHQQAHYEVAAGDYGSDHRPLLGWISSAPRTDRRLSQARALW